jgi:nitrate reductase NapAB chaperone NapD
MATIPTNEPQQPAVDRREFLSGAWRKSSPSTPAASATATVLVQARPGCLAGLEQRLRDMPALSLGPGGFVGQLRVEIALTGAVDLVGALDAIASLPGVLAATLANTAARETTA